jgi:hypothetical protein
MNWAELVGGLGIGSLVTSVATHFMARRATADDRWYQEKREAYIGLLSALHDAAVHRSDAHAKAFALWQTRCDLFGSATVSRYAQRMVDTNDGPADARQEAFAGLVKAMKDDLRGKAST